MQSAVNKFHVCVGFCICFGTMLWLLSSPQHPKLNLKSLHSLNAKVKVVTCSTFEVAEPFDYTVNVCAGKKWKGFGWKMAQLLHYVEAAQDDEETIFALLDGKDALVNRRFFALHFHRKWKQLNADVVVASEEACSAGDDCNQNMIDNLYPTLSKSKSPFVNSPICGYKTPLTLVLKAMIKYGGGRDSADDQLAATQLVNGNIALPPGIRVVHDTNQDIFGSFVHLVNNDNKGAMFSNAHRTCTDGKGNLHVLSCKNVAIKNDGDNYITMQDDVVYDIKQNCDVERLNSQLSTSPAFWHGNGPGWSVFKAVQKKRVRCLSLG